MLKKDFVTRKELNKRIVDSKNGIWMLGTTSFNFPWNVKIDNITLIDSICQKYKNTQYIFSVIAESDQTLAANSLISGLNNKEYECPIAKLTETRDNSTKKIKDYFVNDMGENGKFANSEPLDDVFREKLDALYEEKFFENICKELVVKGNKENELISSIVNLIITALVNKANLLFTESNIVKYYLNKRDFYELSKINGKYTVEIENYIDTSIKNKNIFSLHDLLSCLHDIDISYTFCIEIKEIHNELNCEFLISPKEKRKIFLESALEILVERASNYKLIKEYASKEAYYERKLEMQRLSLESHNNQRFFIKYIYHNIPIQMVKIDNEYFACSDPLSIYNANSFTYIGNDLLSESEDINRNILFYEYNEYFRAFHNSQYITEETAKENRKEVIYNYSSDHVIIGQMPRDSFYGSPNYKLVMWSLVFDRKGRILIHKRSINAKDNQGMWDKSVGGHISLYDRDTIIGASREIAEELYTVEEEEQAHTKGHGWTKVNKDKIIYLGKWNEARYPNFASNLFLEADEFYSFSFDSRMTAQPIDSIRVLPDGTRITAKCFIDLYFVVTSEVFDLNELENSKYLVLSTSQIKKYMKEGILPKEISEKEAGAFEVTPDLEYIINSPEWDNEITKFSLRVEKAFSHE